MTKWGRREDVPVRERRTSVVWNDRDTQRMVDLKNCSGVRCNVPGHGKRWFNQCEWEESRGGKSFDSCLV